jgi:hypothetical protein
VGLEQHVLTLVVVGHLQDAYVCKCMCS